MSHIIDPTDPQESAERGEDEPETCPECKGEPYRCTQCGEFLLPDYVDGLMGHCRAEADSDGHPAAVHCGPVAWNCSRCKKPDPPPDILLDRRSPTQSAADSAPHRRGTMDEAERICRRLESETGLELEDAPPGVSNCCVPSMSHKGRAIIGEEITAAEARGAERGRRAEHALNYKAYERLGPEGFDDWQFERTEELSAARANQSTEEEGT